jgi:hypothetical protein
MKLYASFRIFPVCHLWSSYIQAKHDNAVMTHLCAALKILYTMNRVFIEGTVLLLGLETLTTDVRSEVLMGLNMKICNFQDIMSCIN